MFAKKKKKESAYEMEETWVWSQSWGDPLEEGMVTYSSILNLENSMDRGAWQATVHGAAELDTAERLRHKKL